MVLHSNPKRRESDRIAWQRGTVQGLLTLGAHGLLLASWLSCSNADVSSSGAPAVTSSTTIATSLPSSNVSTNTAPETVESASGAFTRARRALFERREEVSLPLCSADGTCFGGTTTDAKVAPPTASRTLGVEGSPLLYGDDVRFLLDGQRIAEAIAAVDKAIAAAPTASVIQRLILQNDVWERFEALARVEPGHPLAQASAHLRRRLGKLLRALALTPDEARGVASNLPDLAREFDAELGGIHEPGRWFEVRTIYRDSPASFATRIGLRHDVRAGLRMAFRVLARFPNDDGKARLLRHLGDANEPLPPGTRLALVGSPLALTTDGDVLPTRAVTAVESRRIIAPPFPSFDQRPFDVFDADVEGARDRLTLKRMAPDALIPMGATCAPTAGTLVPMRAACLLCHTRAGDRLMGPMSHGEVAFELEPDPEAASRRVAREKRASESMNELRSAWAEP